jgi:hypothetical protein
MVVLAGHHGIETPDAQTVRYHAIFLVDMEPCGSIDEIEKCGPDVTRQLKSLCTSGCACDNCSITVSLYAAL